jgi:thymidylate synthase (FAD)
MIVIKPSVSLEWITPDPLKAIERAGRTCYKSEDKITEDSAEKFYKMIYQKGHESVVEHAVASIRIICDRGVSHEIVRHRLASYSQESTRYCNYSKDKFDNQIMVVEPPFDDDAARLEWFDAMKNIERHYLSLTKRGVSPQLARSVLPNSLKTELVMTANFREWMHFLNLRTSAAAHPQMREVAIMVRDLLHSHCPQIFPGGPEQKDD